MNFLTRSEFREALLSLYKDINKLREKIDESAKENQKGRSPKERITVDVKLDPVSSVEACTPIAEQKTEHRYQLWSLFLQVLTLGAVTAYAIVTYRMWCEMQAQTGLQQKASINAERPWVGLNEPIIIDTFEITPRLKVESHYSIKNFGRGPATKVFVSGWFHTDPKTLTNMAKSTCSMATAFSSGTVATGPNVPNPGPMGYTLFPDQPRNETIGSPADPWQGDGIPNLQHFWFIGCIAYVDQFGKSRWTRFCMGPDYRSRHPINKDIPLVFCALYNDTGDDRVPYP